MHGLAVLALAFVVTACGGGQSRTGVEHVHFPASDGILLDGRLYGRGDLGVVLVHMGRPTDTQADWAGVARLLARKGFHVLTYDRRGVCIRGGTGCSKGTDDYATSWRDVVGAVAFLRAEGAHRIVVAGASIGAMSSLYAVSQGKVAPAGLVEFAGINNASGYSFDRPDIRRIRGPKLFLAARQDIYGGADAARQWFRWASPPKRLVLLPGSEHGTDLLRQSNPLHKRVESIIAGFVEGTLRRGRPRQ